MASLYHILVDIIRTEDDIGNECENAFRASWTYYFAAVRIQKVYRGYAVRKYLKLMHRAATIIQKTFRGWHVRYTLPDVLHEYFDKKCLNQYTEAATKIQALWRGYKVRATEICIREILENKRQAFEANEKMRLMIADRRKKDRESCDEECKEVLEILFNRHHLLRTYQKEGLFSEHGRHEMSLIEMFLHATPWTDYMGEIRREYMWHQSEVNNEPEERHFLKDMADILEPDKTIQKKPLLFKKIERSSYERMIAMTAKYSPQSVASSKNVEVNKNDSDLNVTTDQEEYHPNFWYRQCKIHNM